MWVNLSNMHYCNESRSIHEEKANPSPVCGIPEVNVQLGILVVPVCESVMPCTFLARSAVCA